MERYNSTMRAARHVIGAGTFAAAMLAMTAASASAQTTICDDGGEGDTGRLRPRLHRREQ